MKSFKIIAAVLSLLFLSGCMSSGNMLPTWKITSIEVNKADREMILRSYGFPIKRYTIDLGSEPVGPKRQRGDGKTPEGDYHITHVNTESAFTLSLGINYPNALDTQISKSLGVDPGDDIFIHGLPNGYGATVPDWTNGCVAVSNADIREIVSMVRPEHR